MDLTAAEEGKEYIVKKIQIEDDEIKSFLTSLGCYENEIIKVVLQNRFGGVFFVKGAKYSFDRQLEKSIRIAERK